MASADEHLYILVINPNILINGVAFELDWYLNQACIITLLHCGTPWSYCVCVYTDYTILVYMDGPICVYVSVCIYLHIHIFLWFFPFLLPSEEALWWPDLSKEEPLLTCMCSNLRNQNAAFSLPCDWLWWVITGALAVVHPGLLCANTWIQQMATLFLRHQNRLLGAPPVRYGQHPPALQNKNSHQTRVWAMTMWLIVAMVIWSSR